MRKTLLALSVAGALFASNTPYDYELTAALSGVKPEGNLDLKEHAAYGLRLGKNLQGFVFDQLELGIDYTHYVEVQNSNAKTDITRFFANFVKDLASFGDAKFYGLVGLGYEDLAENFAGNRDEMFGQYGVGLRYNFTDSLAIKGEVKHAVKIGSADNNLFYSIGLAYAFGERAVEEPKVQEEKVVEEKVVEEKVVVDGDDDNDGVLNSKDKCPNTPSGVVVDSDGCVKVIRLNVQFGFDKAKIRPEYMEKIEEVANFMKDNDGYTVVLEGHTDSTGPKAYNQKLSEQRANAVAEQLVKLGVASEKISTVGYGETQPAYDNSTKEGRAQNRRVDSKFNY